MPIMPISLAAFFGAAVLLYFFVPNRFRWLLLLVASYAFYMLWNVPHILVLLFSTLSNYLLGKAIASPNSAARRKIALAVGIAFNLVLLFIFKYLNATLAEALKLSDGSAMFSIALPIGISFYTFKGMSYLFDIYQGKLQPEEKFGLFAAYIAFFPQVVAGPIERATGLLPQLQKQIVVNEAKVVEGLRLMLWGAFKKAVIADRLAVYVNEVYRHPQMYHGLNFILATFFFAFQVYCDFSGYSDIAIGAAKVLGFESMANFRQPYLSSSIREFWQRWHISLSTWIRDYLFFPLARASRQMTGGRFPRLTQLIVNLIAMGLVGLWHGAGGTFVIWGALHGAYLAVESWFHLAPTKLTRLRPLPRYAVTLAGIALTFGLVCFAWIFFRASTLSDAFYIIGHLMALPPHLLRGSGITAPFGTNAMTRFVTAWVLLVLMVVVDALDARWGINRLLDRSPGLLRWSLYYAATAGILLLGFGARQEFIYFKF